MGPAGFEPAISRSEAWRPILARPRARNTFSGVELNISLDLSPSMQICHRFLASLHKDAIREPLHGSLSASDPHVVNWHTIHSSNMKLHRVRQMISRINWE